MKKWLQKKWVQRTGWIVLLLLCWQAAASSGLISPMLLPGLTDVAKELWRSFTGGQLLAQIGLSLGLIAAGLAIAGILSLLLAYGALHSKIIASLADTLCMLAHPLPAIALLPLIIVWFGVGIPAIIAIIAHSATWPLLLNLLAGFEAVPKVYVESGKSLSLRAFRMLWAVYLPASASYLFSGIKTGWARAWRALISAEMLFGAVGAHGGIGWYLFKNRVLMNTAGLFAGIVVVVLTGMAVDGLLALVEKQTIRRWGEA